MKKALLAVLFTGVLCNVFAQVDGVYYYYQGKKFFLATTNRKIVVGLKQATSFSAAKTSVFAALRVKTDSIKRTTTANQYVIGFGKDEEAVGKASAQTLLNNPLVAYVHPGLMGQAGRLVTYGDAFVVKLKSGISSTQLNALLTKYHCTVIRTSPGDKNTLLISAGARNNYDALKTANLFFETNLFDFSQPDFTTHGGLADAPNDPLLYLQWAFRNTGSPEQHAGIAGADLNVDSAWIYTKGNSNIKIAVIDTGVDSTQVDLKANLIQGYDCTTQTSNPGDGAPKNLTNAHGTACAGIIAAAANNGKGITGIAPKCKIMPINISSEFDVFASDFDIAGGIDYAWQNGADVLTNSWTAGTASGTIDAAIHRAVTQGRAGKGCLFFAAAGNDNGGISYPACNPEAIAVGGSNMANQRKSPNSWDGESWWGANYGNGLDVVAPCVQIATTDMSGENGYNKTAGSDGDYHFTFNGTSAATPHAAAVAALVLSMNSAFTAAEVRAIVENSCTKPAEYIFGLTIGNPNGTWNNEMGYGIVNAYKSVLAAKNKKFCGAGIVPPANPYLCKNASVKLSLQDTLPNAIFTWRLNGTASQTGKYITVSVPGSYDVVAKFPNGCIATTAVVAIYAADTSALVADAGKTVTLCPGGSAIIGGTPSAKGGATIMGGQRAYGYDILFGTFRRFSIENPREYKYIPVGAKDGVTSTQFIAGDFTPRGYYAITRGGELAKIDTATGYVRLVGRVPAESGQYLSHFWSGLSWNPVTQKLVGITNGGLANGIYEIDLVTGKPVLTGHLQSSLSWGTFNAQGTMYAYNTNYDRIVRISANNNSYLPGSIGITPLVQLDASFDPYTNKLYMSTYAVGQFLFGDLREIDTLTGKVSVKGDIAGVSEVGALAIAGGTYKYAWAPTAGLSNAKDANPIAKPTSTTSYTLTVTDACGAKATSQVLVTANADKPVVKITAEKDSICVNESTRLSVTKDSNYTYQWMYNGFALDNPNDTFYVANRGGKFQVSVTNGPGGCANTSKTFTLKDCSILLKDFASETTCYSYFYPPNGFTDTGFRPNQTFTKTIYPVNPGDRMQVTFRKFYAGGPSYLTIYDGPDANAPVLKELTYYDNNLTNLVITSSTGPLTFKLQAGTNEYDIGNWDAFLTCYTPHVYMTKQNGKFEDASTWKIKTGDNVFADAITPPTFAEDSIIIQSGHVITLNAYYLTVDELWLQKGASLVLNGSLSLGSSGKFAMTADGDITLNPGGALYGKANVSVRGNITAGSNFIQNSLYADGDAPQTFNFANGGLTSLHVINKTGITIHGRFQIDSLFMSSMAGLHTDSFSLRTRLILDSGVIHIKTPGVVELSGSHLYYTKGNDSSYVDGALALATAYIVNSNLYYPIGSATGFRPINFRFDKYVNDVYTVQALNQPAPVMPLPPGIDGISAAGYYSVKALHKYAIPNVAVTIPYRSGDGVTDPANLRIVRDSAAKWWDAGGVGTHADTGTITSTNKIALLGNLAIANATGGDNTLPVTWLQFTAAPQGKNVLLQWKVAQEVNCDNYIAEYSMDGRNFTALATLRAYNNGNAVNNYQYLHRSALTATNFYRIKETDKNGRYMYSAVVRVRLNEGPAYLVTPNPARDVVIIKAVDVIKEIDCYNALGQLVKKILPGSTLYRLTVKGLTAGIYNIRVITASGVYNTKLVKE